MLNAIPELLTGNGSCGLAAYRLVPSYQIANKFNRSPPLSKHRPRGYRSVWLCIAAGGSLSTYPQQKHSNA